MIIFEAMFNTHNAVLNNSVMEGSIYRYLHVVLVNIFKTRSMISRKIQRLPKEIASVDQFLLFYNALFQRDDQKMFHSFQVSNQKQFSGVWKATLFVSMH